MRETIVHQQELEKQRFEDQMQKITNNDKLMSLGHLLEWSAQEYGDHVALETQEQSISYVALYKRASMFSHILHTQGIKEGDAVLVLLENTIEFYIAYFAVLQIGAIVAPLNVYLTEHELSHIINDAQAKLIITSDQFSDRLQQVHNKVPIIFVENEKLLDVPIVDTAITIPDKDPDALTLLLYTSGTTGLPKGVMISSTNALTNACQAIARITLPQSRILCVLPLFHSFMQNTCVWTPLLYGCTIILVRKIDRRLIVEGLQKKPDIFLGVPALYGLLCLMKTAPLETIKLFICGADALPAKIRVAFGLIYGRKIANGYGLTEASPFISVDLDDVIEPTNSVGLHCVDLDIQIRDEHGTVLPQGEIGQLWVKGKNVMLGYYNAEEATNKILQDCWLNTGDLAYIGHSGKIVISGREKDLIINKGINIYPQEIENVLLMHSDVMRAAVIGKVDPDGEIPVAVVQLRVENEQIKEQLLRLCRERLAPYKIPKEFIVIHADPPLTATGKVNKKALKKELFGE